MNKRVHLILGGLLTLAALLPVKAAAAYWTDDSLQPDSVWYTEHKGETEYTITTPEQLAGLSALVNTHGVTFEGKTVKLGSSISLQKTVGEAPVLWKPMGYYEKNKGDIRFKGKFDGQGHTVDYMIVDATLPCNGLFGATLNAEVVNLTIGANSTVTSTRECTAALIGYAEATRIENCINNAAVAAVQKININRVGGLIGGMIKSYISNSTNNGAISTAESCGGIAGGTSGGDTIVNCINTAPINSGGGNYIGGIVGYAYDKTSILNCINTGAVNGGNAFNAGGIFGRSYNLVQIRNCVNLGTVSNDNTAFGPIGGLAQGTFAGLRNFSLENILMGTPAANSIKVTELTEEQMKSEVFAKELTAYAGYLNNNDVSENLNLAAWSYVAGEYPSFGAQKAGDTYKVAVTPTLLGDIAMGVLSTDDPAASYFASAANVEIPVTPYSGYTFYGIELNGVFHSGSSSFVMPQEDVTVTAVFNAGSVNTWADMAQHAVPDNDYKKPDEYTYEVYTAKGLAYAAQQINNGNTDEETIINLAADIDLGVENASGDTLLWIPAGTDVRKFRGIFDGKGFSVNNMIIKSTVKYAGLFGYADGAEIKNVTVAANSRISNTEQYTGAVVGYAAGTIIVNCHNKADVTVTVSKTATGGIAGAALESSSLSFCSNTGKISSVGLMAGGLVGWLGNNNGVATVTNSYNAGIISSGGTSGGLVGMLQTPTSGTAGKSMIANCYNTANVTVTGNMAGGIAGSINKFSEVKNCVSYAAVVSSTNKSGGIVGSVADGALFYRNYYRKGTVAGVDISRSGDSLTVEQMQGKDLPNEMTVFAGYMNNKELTDYVQWTYTANQYPVLDASRTKAANAYVLTVKTPVNGTAVMTAPAAVIATDSTALFVKNNTSVTFTATPDASYLFYALKANGTEQAEYSYTFRTSAADTEVEVLFSRPRRWDFLAPDAVAGTDYSLTGDGYQVHTNLGLAWIADKVNAGDNMAGKNISLTADIDLGKKNQDNELISWAPVGSGSSKQFKGNFNGNGYKVKDMVVKASAGYGGLFGYIASDTIANVTVSGNSSVTGTTYLGAIAGYLTGSAVIMNCNNDGCAVSSTSSYSGGITGYAASGCQVLNSSNNAPVSGASATGGIAGYLQGRVENCLNTALVTTTNKGGGIIGDGYNPVVLRSYRVKENVTGATAENTAGKEIESDVAKSVLLSDELSAYAGYLNRTASKNFNAWTLSQGKAPVVGAAKAADAYNAVVESSSEYGSVSLPQVISADAPAEFMANAGNTVVLAVTSDPGYTLSALNVNGEAVSHAENSFVMPSQNVLLTFEFGEFVPETWADVADDAIADTDYKQSGSNYDIYTPYGFAYVAKLVNSGEIAEETTIQLMAELDFGVVNTKGDTLRWVPAGTETAAFKAKFDGKNHAIDHLVVDSEGNYSGLFGYADGAEIVNVNIARGSRITSAGQYTGAVVGYADNTYIAGCSNAAAINVTANKLYTGGIAGGAYGTSVITGCSNTGNIISAGGSAAGIAGAMGNTSSTCHLTNCMNSGNISAEKNSVAGIVGMMQGNRPAGDNTVWVTLSNCVNSGNISGGSMVGGITGFMGALYVKNCVNYGTVSAPGGKTSVYAGAITGYINNAVAKNGGCQFFRNYTLEQLVTNPDGTIIDDSKTELSGEAMKTEELRGELSRHAGYLSAAEYTEVSAWVQGNAGYPVLSGEAAVQAYAVTIDEALANAEEGTVRLPEMVSVNDSVYYACEGDQVALRVNPAQGYVEWLKANDILIENGSFVMPGEDVFVEGTFSHISVEGNDAGQSRVWATGSVLYVENSADIADLVVVTADGRVALNEKIYGGVSSYTLPAGVYLVKVSGKLHKVIVK